MTAKLGDRVSGTSSWPSWHHLCAVADASWKLLQRTAALSGALGSIVIFVAIDLLDPSTETLSPDPTMPSSELARAFATNRASARLGAQLLLLGAFLMLWFGAFLFSRIRRTEREPDWTGPLVLAGGIVLAAMALVESSFAYAVSELSDYGGETELSKMIAVWGWDSSELLAPGLTAILFAMTAAGFRHKALPRGLAWFSAVILLFMLLISVIFQAPGFAAIAGLFWTVVLSLVLAFRRGEQLSK